jgi:ribosomal protein S18 acetylase RimI-like enzyme
MSTRGDLALRPFTVDAAEIVSSWATTPDEVAFWCSMTEAPVPPDVIAGWSRQSDVRSYLLCDADGPVAYGELWIDDEEREVELARIIVDPRQRGRHLGRTLTQRLADQAHRLHPTVFLRVRPANDAALACYNAAGFTRVDPDTEREWNHGQPTPYVWMIRKHA